MHHPAEGLRLKAADPVAAIGEAHAGDEHRHQPAAAQHLTDAIGDKRQRHGRQQQLLIRTHQAIDQAWGEQSHQQSGGHARDQMHPHSPQLLRQAGEHSGMQPLVLAVATTLQDSRREAEAQQGCERAQGRLELEQMAESSAHGMAQGQHQILEGAAVRGAEATHRQHCSGRRQAGGQQRRQSQQGQARDRQREQHPQAAEPQTSPGHPADAAQVGTQAGVEDQQGQAHPMQGFELHRAEGLGLRHQLGGDGQTQQQDRGGPRHPATGRHSIHR